MIKHKYSIPWCYGLRVSKPFLGEDRSAGPSLSQGLMPGLCTHAHTRSHWPSTSIKSRVAAAWGVSWRQGPAVPCTNRPETSGFVLGPAQPCLHCLCQGYLYSRWFRESNTRGANHIPSSWRRPSHGEITTWFPFLSSSCAQRGREAPWSNVPGCEPSAFRAPAHSAW